MSLIMRSSSGSSAITASPDRINGDRDRDSVEGGGWQRSEHREETREAVKDRRGRAPPSPTNRCTRRQLLGGAAVASGVPIGASGKAAAQDGGGASEVPDFGGYLSGAKGGAVEDHRGTDAVTVTVGGGGGLAFLPTGLWIDPGTEVTFEWASNNHNVVVESQPEGAAWEGSPGSETYNEGYSFSTTFDTGGIYQYYCQPHRPQGMIGGIAVGDDVETEPVGGGAGCTADDLHACGVPLQAHWVGVATILMLTATLVFTFYLLKFYESPHTKGGE